jgi:hypothetical protein
MRGVFWKVKSMSVIFNRYERMEMSLFVHPYRAVNSDRDLATLFCVQEKILTVCTMASRL